MQPSVVTARPVRPASTKLLVVRAGDELIVFLADHYGPACVAATPSGRRCAHLVDVGARGWEEWLVPPEMCVTALNPGVAAAEAFRQQRCPRHYRHPAPDFCEPDWEPFDPATHAGCLHPHPLVWTPDGAGVLVATHLPVEVGVPARRALPAQVPIPVPRAREMSTALYRYFDEDGLLLYVGITDHLAIRAGTHVKKSSWAEFAVRSTITRYSTRGAAEEAELIAIREEEPLFNHQHNDTERARERVVRYLVRRNRLDLLAPAVSRG